MPLLRQLAAQSRARQAFDQQYRQGLSDNAAFDAQAQQAQIKDATDLMAARRANAALARLQNPAAAANGAPPVADASTVAPAQPTAPATGNLPQPPTSILKKLNGSIQQTAQQPTEPTPGLAGARASQLARKLAQPEAADGTASAGSDAAANGGAADSGGAVEEVPVPNGLLHTQVSPADLKVAQKATEELKQAVGPLPQLRAMRYSNAVAQRQARIRDRLMALSGDPRFPSDDTDLGSALAQVRNVRSREALEAHVGDITSRTSPEVANVIRSYLGPQWARSIWNASPITNAAN
jgi:hypothetical protein